MIARIVAYAKSKLRSTAERIEAEYQEAQRAYLRAQARKDTRAQHDAWPRLRDALDAKLRLETSIRPAPSAWRGSR